MTTKSLYNTDHIGNLPKNGKAIDQLQTLDRNSVIPTKQQATQVIETVAIATKYHDHDETPHIQPNQIEEYPYPKTTTNEHHYITSRTKQKFVQQNITQQ